MESTFHARESEGNKESMTTTATPRIVSMNEMIGNVVVCSKSDLSTIDFTNKTILLQDVPIQHVATNNIVEDDCISSNFLICYDGRRNASLRFVKLSGPVDSGEKSNNVSDILPA